MRLKAIPKEEAEKDEMYHFLRHISLVKADKISTRYARYYKNKDATGNFAEEDVDTLEYRDMLDEIEKLHQENFLLHSNILLSMNKISDALRIINDSLTKIDHRDIETLK